MMAAVIHKFVLAFVVYRGMGFSKTVFPGSHVCYQRDPFLSSYGVQPGG